MTNDAPSASFPGAGRLRRDVGLGGAVMMGLGSILGTGVFVSVGIASGLAGASVFARVSAAGNPTPAVLGVGVVIGLIAATGSIRLAWSFSAFTVLVSYAITNLAALRLGGGVKTGCTTPCSRGRGWRGVWVWRSGWSPGCGWGAWRCWRAGWRDAP